MKLALALMCLLGIADSELRAATLAQRQSTTNQVTDYSTLLKKFREVAVNVEPAGSVDQPFLSVRGKVIKVYGEDVQVFEYPSAAEMEGEAARISPDGGGIGTRKIFWTDPPHFYKQGRALVLYVGDDGRVEKTLKTVLGQQFAGQ
ncbi:MAG: hypothetical protein ACM3SP_24735 [Chloroflexota bacterium]